MKVIKRSLLFTYASEAQKPAVLTRASITPYDNTLKQGRMLELRKKKKKCKWYYKLLTLLSNDTFLCNKFLRIICKTGKRVTHADTFAPALEAQTNVWVRIR